MEVLFISFLTFVATWIGGVFGIRHRDRLHQVISFTAGVLLGVIFFDIMPEIFEMTAAQGLSITRPLVMVVIGFLAIHTLEKLAIIHTAHEEEYAEHKHPTVGLIGASGLAVHSFLDGVGIGLGFHVSPQVGIIIAIAVIAHDFSDGLNTVSVMLMHKNTEQRARRLLLVDAIAPVLGALSTLLFTIPQNWLVLYLGFFAGFLLYISASELLPEAHSKHSSWRLIALTMLGALFIFVVTRFA